MSAFLVSFILLDDRFGMKHGSHIFELPAEPSRAQSVMDLQVSIGLQYGTTGALITSWDLLPDRDSHPSGSGPYCYFLTYTVVSARGNGFGSTDFMRTHPLRTLEDLRAVEEYLRSQAQVSEAHLLSCKSLKEPTSGLLFSYEQALRQSM